MPSPEFQIRIRLSDDRVIAPTAAQRRVAVRVILEKGRPFGLTAYALPDTHGHLVAACSRREAGELARRIELSLGRRLSISSGFSPPFIEKVRGGGHLSSLFWYFLRQGEHHGLSWDPRQEATCLPELLGLRPLGGYLAENVRRALPRINRQALLKSLGVDELGLADGPMHALRESTLAASVLPDLKGSRALVVAARCAAVHAAGGHNPAAALGQELGIAPRTVQWLRARRPDPDLVRAIGGQLDLSRRLSLTPDLQGPFVVDAKAT